MIEIILAFVLGILAGVLTGLAPGIHINLVSSALLAYSVSSPVFSTLTLVTFIVSMTITHTFIDFIPSVFLGVPEEDSFLAVLPSQKMVKNGKGYEAVILSLKGALSALIPILIIIAPFIILIPVLFELIKSAIPFLLIFFSLFLVFRERNIFPALVILSLSGLLGILTFHLPVKEPLLPLLSGLFGTSSLIISLKDNPALPVQKIPSIKNIHLPGKQKFRSLLLSSMVSPFCSFLPAIGSGHAATICSELSYLKSRAFLFTLGSINLIVMTLSFATAYAIGKTRTGSSAAVKSILVNITLAQIAFIIMIIVISAVTAFFIGTFLSKKFASLLNKISYRKISIITLIIILLVNILLSNWLGILVLIVSTFLGLFTILSKSRRIHLMGSLLIPSILYYLLN